MNNNGTLRFMAPELLIGDSPRTLASDVYAFGMLGIQVWGTVLSASDVQILTWRRLWQVARRSTKSITFIVWLVRYLMDWDSNEQTISLQAKRTRRPINCGPLLRNAGRGFLETDLPWGPLSRIWVSVWFYGHHNHPHRARNNYIYPFLEHLPSPRTSFIFTPDFAYRR